MKNRVKFVESRSREIQGGVHIYKNKKNKFEKTTVTHVNHCHTYSGVRHG